MPTPPARARRACPACVRREECLIADDCPICEGTGVLELGAAALSRYTPATVSRAVEVALETQARFSLAVPHPDLGRAREDLAQAVARLRAGKILANRGEAQLPGQQGTRGRYERASAARELLGDPGNAVTEHELWRRERWAPDDRPLAAGHGALPPFSAAFFLCALARVTDPLDPLTSSVRERVRSRELTERGAAVLAGSVPPAALF